MADLPALDPDYTMKGLTAAALQKLVENPWTDPDTTPPAEGAAAARGAATLLPQQSVEGAPSTSPDAMMTPAAALPRPSSPAATQSVSLNDQMLTDEVKAALEVLERDGIAEQISEHAWRFKQPTVGGGG